ncbi:MAG TPA: hypothetical protein VMM38_06700 [Aridibacter sp.]|nr:hypothetical protein [Aridibacter sp.]
MIRTLHRLLPLLLTAAFILTAGAGGVGVYAQSNASEAPKEKSGSKPKILPKPPLPPKPPKAPKTKSAVVASSGSDEVLPPEKAIVVRPDVYVSLCVRRGAVRVNGWNRKEVRIFHRGGKELGLKVLERDGEKVPTWVEVLGYEPEKATSGSDKCLTGEMIELDVPNGASVTIKGLSSETSVEGIKSAAVEIVGGDIYLNDIASRIEARTQQGGVTVNNSKGKMAVATTTGNIVAYNTEAVDAGDYFKAKTRSGSVTLQSIGQKDIVASTITGSINYLGEIKNYGKYEFSTTNGILNIVLPESACFWINAAYGGRFISDFKVTVITEDETESAMYLKGRVCSGEANLSLRSYSGTIHLRKREATAGDPRIVIVP